jgi:hypothetical protein
MIREKGYPTVEEMPLTTSQGLLLISSSHKKSNPE